MARGPVKKLEKFVRERFRYARRCRESRYRCSKYAGLLDEVKAFCLFIGYPRSGHSLIGALLDAHESVAMAHELSSRAFARSSASSQTGASSEPKRTLGAAPVSSSTAPVAGGGGDSGDGGSDGAGACVP